jgi:hypothetical protein
VLPILISVAVTPGVSIAMTGAAAVSPQTIAPTIILCLTFLSPSIIDSLEVLSSYGSIFSRRRIWERKPRIC